MTKSDSDINVEKLQLILDSLTQYVLKFPEEKETQLKWERVLRIFCEDRWTALSGIMEQRYCFCGSEECANCTWDIPDDDELSFESVIQRMADYLSAISSLKSLHS